MLCFDDLLSLMSAKNNRAIAIAPHLYTSQTTDSNRSSCINQNNMYKHLKGRRVRYITLKNPAERDRPRAQTYTNTIDESRRLSAQQLTI